MRVYVHFVVAILALGLTAARLQAAGAPPVFTSPVAVTPASNAPGLQCQFSAVATSPSSLPLTYSWNFGDGTTSIGDPVQHVYTAVGNYTVTLTVTDSGGASATQSIAYSIQAPGIGSFADTDSDGFPDELEVFLGVSPFDATATPITPVTPTTIRSFNCTALNIGLRFDKPHRDTVQFAGTLPFPGLNPVSGQKITFDIGGILRTYTLDQRGGLKSVSTNGNFLDTNLKVGTVRVAGTKNVKFVLKLRGDFAATLAVDGLVNATIDTGLDFRALVLFQSTLYDKTVRLRYKAKAGHTGKARLQ